ncbi:5-hydroxyisourate hydrolase [Colletotrichum higginsianum]|uniref:5-hydroxyisourate hydrolase n=1 Tax=Colletotrichum higginsianum TaxID=80884 RepID=A0A4T0VI14_9PEZI|nr:5-hydroxyisourate hydrolase [Colletotrichum higginsianum]
MASPAKDRITCHVLDTSKGRPAKGIRVYLSTTTATASGPGTLREFESLTDDDGRVPVYTLEDVLGAAPGPSSRWTLRFDTAAYFGGDDETFFPEAVVVFTVREGQHYHVPLLLSPYSYTTYRGS